MTGALTGPTFNATTSIQTAGTVRIDASGVLSNVSVPAGASTVNIDAARITTGTLPPSLFPAASIDSAGIVRLSNSTSSTDSNLAATPLAVRTAWNLANDALPRSGGIITGTLIVQTVFTGPAFSILWTGTNGSFSDTNGIVLSTNLTTTVLANNPGYSTTMFTGSNISVPAAGVYCLSASTYIQNNQQSIVSFNQYHSVSINRVLSGVSTGVATFQGNGNNVSGTWCTASWTGHMPSSGRFNVVANSFDWDRQFGFRTVSNTTITLTKLL